MEQIQRLISVLIILPPLLLFLIYASAVFFLILVLVLTAVSLHEYFTLLAQSQGSLDVGVSYIAALALVLVAYWGGWQWLPMGLFLSVVSLTLAVMLTSREVASLFPGLVYGVFGIILIGWNLSHLILLRDLPSGQWYILFLGAIVWTEDSAAMYVGRLLGRHKMAPRLSPGKTWEGAAGGLIGGVLAAVVSAHVLLPDLGVWHGAIVGLLVALVAQVSDLGESILKRYAGVKDSGGLIPGHGGILDRIDSLLFAAPTLVYALAVLGVVSFF